MNNTMRLNFKVLLFQMVFLMAPKQVIAQFEEFSENTLLEIEYRRGVIFIPSSLMFPINTFIKPTWSAKAILCSTTFLQAL
ncbi:MAG TPA: hypothetical protein VKA10_12415 [Prolixibacteraceae bacterium]|nr:hypothetical protein [Prolixibacteraceae bacterium]